MAKVLGIGGIFFKCRDKKKLCDWYEKWLHLPIDREFYGGRLEPSDQPPGSYTVWGPFAADTKYFDPCTREFMFNLIVDNLDEALSQVEQGGARLVGGTEEYPFGRFGWFMDPEGNKVELWQPKEVVDGDAPSV